MYIRVVQNFLMAAKKCRPGWRNTAQEIGLAQKNHMGTIRLAQTIFLSVEKKRSPNSSTTAQKTCLAQKKPIVVHIQLALHAK